MLSRMFQRSALRLSLVVLSCLAFAGCGGDSDNNAAAVAQTPTAVTAEDLQKTGEFWIELTPDLKDELVNAGKDQLGIERPDGATEIKAVDDDALIEEINKQYTNAAKRPASIYRTYVAANDALAMERFNQLAPALENGE